ncbi:MAG: 4-hydroxy-tetrahydrodipicolinate synthase, partial [Clostridia bacterium]|nr:4-hydroxy-tetrahydrodipicolinate synthase [Clostridia bacterium]
DAGVSGLVVGSTTGEGTLLTPSEKISLLRYVCAFTEGKIPIIAGVSAHTAKQAIEIGKEMENAGADGLLVMTPYLTGVTQDGLVDFFGQVAMGCAMPFIIYHSPARSGVKIEVETFAKLAELPYVVGIKETDGDLSRLSSLLAEWAPSIPFYAGHEDLLLPLLSFGGAGIISVLSNLLPKEMMKTVHYFSDGDFQLAKEIWRTWHPLVAPLFCEVNPIPIKAALSAVGLCENRVRPPLFPNTEMASVWQKWFCEVGLSW